MPLLLRQKTLDGLVSLASHPENRLVGLLEGGMVRRGNQSLHYLSSARVDTLLDRGLIARDGLEPIYHITAAGERYVCEMAAKKLEEVK